MHVAVIPEIAPEELLVDKTGKLADFLDIVLKEDPYMDEQMEVMFKVRRIDSKWVPVKELELQGKQVTPLTGFFI